MSEEESRTQGSRPRTQKNFEAKDQARSLDLKKGGSFFERVRQL